jgi:anti-sigma B factor antagonist
MRIKTEQKTGADIFRPEGDLDINTSPEFKMFFDKMAKEKSGKMVIDFKNVGYVDSSGLATLVEIFKKVRAYNGKMKLSGFSPKVRGLFEITKLDRLFNIFDNEDDALDSEW